MRQCQASTVSDGEPSITAARQVGTVLGDRILRGDHATERENDWQQEPSHYRECIIAATFATVDQLRVVAATPNVFSTN